MQTCSWLAAVSGYWWAQAWTPMIHRLVVSIGDLLPRRALRCLVELLFHWFLLDCTHQPVGLGVQDITIGARGLWFECVAGQIKHGVAITSPLLQRFSELCYPAAEMGLATRYTVRRNIESILKIWYLICNCMQQRPIIVINTYRFGLFCVHFLIIIFIPCWNSTLPIIISSS